MLHPVGGGDRGEVWDEGLAESRSAVLTCKYKQCLCCGKTPKLRIGGPMQQLGSQGPDVQTGERRALSSNAKRWPSPKVF